MLWYNFHSSEYSNPDKYPSFYDEKDFDWAQYILANWQPIRQELMTFIEKEKQVFKPYFDNTKDEQSGKWQTITFKTWGIDVKNRLRETPHLMSFLDKYPQVTTCSLNLLKGNAIVKPHHGDTNAILRCHIGMVIPKGLPDCGFEVEGEQRAWQEDGILIFSDALYHRAWNHSAQDRILFVFDVIRDEYRVVQNAVCISVRANLLLMKLASRYPFLYKMPILIQKIMRTLMKGILLILLPIQRKKGVLTQH